MGALAAATQAAPHKAAQMSVSHVAERTEKIAKSDAEWRALLTPEQYRITFESGTGPSFDRPTSAATVIEHADRSYVMTRTEARCTRYVFPDGLRETTGQRYGINGTALAFKPGDP